MKRIFLLVVLILVAWPAGASSEDDAEPNPLQVSIRPVLPLNFDDPEIIATYSYVGKKEVFELHMPIRAQMKKFRELELKADGREPKFAYEISDKDDFAYKKPVEFRQNDCFDLKIKLKKIYDLPKDWKKIEIKPMHDRGESMTSIPKARLEETLILERAEADNKLAHFHVSVSPILPLDPADPEIVLTYCCYNVGLLANTKPASLFHGVVLPTAKEIGQFRGIHVKADGKEIPFVAKGPARVKDSRFIPLETGESCELRLKLKEMYQLPKDWKKLEVKPGDLPTSNARATVVGSLILERKP